MEANAKKHLQHMSYLGLAAVIFVGGTWIHQQHVISHNTQAVRMINLKANRYHKDRLGYTTTKLQKNYDNEEPNLGTALSTNQQNVKKGLQLAFSSCRTLHTLSQARPKVVSMLGTDITNPILNSLQAQLKDSNNTDSSKPTKGDSIDMLHISYGKYDDNENVVPIEVLVKYRTPPIKQDSGSGSLKPVGQKKVSPTHKGYMELNGTLNPKAKTMNLNNYHNQLEHS